MMEPSSRLAARLEKRAATPRQPLPAPAMPLAEVWEGKLREMPLRALLGSLGFLRRIGLLAEGSEGGRAVAAGMADPRAIRESGLHPVELLAARLRYVREHSVRGTVRGQPVASLVEALDAAFHLAFANVEPSGRRTLVALDVSGSMASPVRGLELVSCREVAAAMSLVAAATEPEHRFAAFACDPGSGWLPRRRSGLSTLTIPRHLGLDEVVHLTGWLPFGVTDCALPMLEAARRRWSVELFVVYTDSETGPGEVHPAEALRRYRDRTGIPARLVVVAMASKGFTLADPEDGGMLDVAGFDADTPRVLAEFAR